MKPNCRSFIIGSYCDSLLNSAGIRSMMSENEVEAKLDKLVMLFTCLSEKGMFQELCRKQLAKRLLYDMCNSEDAERFLIGKLKQTVGIHATSKFEGVQGYTAQLRGLAYGQEWR